MTLTSLLPRRKRRGDIGLRKDHEGPYPAFRREMDRLLDRFFRSLDDEPFGAIEAMEGDFMPSIDVRETNKEIKVTAELPGMDENDIDITLSKASLTLKGEKKEETEDQGKDYFRIERRFGSFYRVIPVVAEVDESKVDARFKKGVLTIRLPKSAEAQNQRRRIQVKST